MLDLYAFLDRPDDCDKTLVVFLIACDGSWPKKNVTL